MNKKPIKAEEPAGAYTVKKTAVPARADGRVVTAEDVTKVVDKIFSERKELLRKLAQ